MSGVISNKSDLYTPAGANDFRGDYLGFTFNGIHSSELGLVRVSSSNRYDDNLLPTIQDKTVQVPGGDGMYFFGSYYTQRQFTVSFAFDALTDAQLRRLRTVLGDKKIHPLIFDEMPYKVYQAKVTGNNTVKHLAFDHGQGARIYKGEGSIQFTCYFPFARSRYKYKEDYRLSTIPEWKDESDINISEWIEASGMLDEQGDYDILRIGSVLPEPSEFDGFSRLYADTNDVEPPAVVNRNDYVVYTDTIAEVEDQDNNGYSLLDALSYWTNPQAVIEEEDLDGVNSCAYVPTRFLNAPGDDFDYTGFKTYNPGDLPVDWKLFIPRANAELGGTIYIVDEGETYQLNIDIFTANSNDQYVVVDTKNNLIYGSNTGTIYNTALLNGIFFKIPLGENIINLIGFGIDPSTQQTWSDGRLEYDYLYY